MIAAELTQKLIACESVTPHEGGCFAIIEKFLWYLGFECETFTFDGVSNFYAKRIPSPAFDRSAVNRHMCFLGHVDVVPAQNPDQWKFPPFSGHEEDGIIYGRGAVDMKGAIGSLLHAFHNISCWHTLSLLLTSDEEGQAQNGIKKMVPLLQERGEKIDLCIGMEPTNPKHVGEMIKIGRRGSLSFTLSVKGEGGHVAYPKESLNPIPVMMKWVDAMTHYQWDEGDEFFDPTHCEIISIDAGNETFNLIPSTIRARGNIRFGPTYTGARLQETIDQLTHTLFKDTGCAFEITYDLSGEAFRNVYDHLTHFVQRCVSQMTDQPTVLSTTGGTSDARFMKDLCPVIEFGLSNYSAHKVDEHVSIKDLKMLTWVYQELIMRFENTTLPNDDEF